MFIDKAFQPEMSLIAKDDFFYLYWPLWLSILESSIVNAWKLNVLVNKRLGLQNISQLQFRIKLETDLLITPDEEEPMEEEVKSDSGRDPGGNMKMDDLPHVAGQHHIITHPKKVGRPCIVCHKSTVRMCHKCQVHLHIDISLYFYIFIFLYFYIF